MMACRLQSYNNSSIRQERKRDNGTEEFANLFLPSLISSVSLVILTDFSQHSIALCFSVLTIISSYGMCVCVCLWGGLTY